MARPYYSNLAGSSDLAGAVVGGLAAASAALNKTDPTLASQLLQAATVRVHASCMSLMQRGMLLWPSGQQHHLQSWSNPLASLRLHAMHCRRLQPTPKG